MAQKLAPYNPLPRIPIVCHAPGALEVVAATALDQCTRRIITHRPDAIYIHVLGQRFGQGTALTTHQINHPGRHITGIKHGQQFEYGQRRSRAGQQYHRVAHG